MGRRVLGLFFNPGKDLEDLMPPVYDVRAVQAPVCVPAEAAEEPLKKKTRLTPDKNFHAVVKNRAVVSWTEKRDSERQRALVRWSNLVLMWEPGGDDRILELQAATPEHRLDLLETYMARKAPATMLKRAFSLFRLMKLTHRHGIKFPCAEIDLFNLMSEAKSGGATLSQLRGFMEALTFARFVFELVSFKTLCASRKCWGVVF